MQTAQHQTAAHSAHAGAQFPSFVIRDLLYRLVQTEMSSIKVGFLSCWVLLGSFGLNGCERRNKKVEYERIKWNLSDMCEKDCPQPRQVWKKAIKLDDFSFFWGRVYFRFLGNAVKEPILYPVKLIFLITGTWILIYCVQSIGTDKWKKKKITSFISVRVLHHRVTE